MLRLGGVVLLVIGAVAGALILTEPFGGVGARPSALWLLFAIGTFGGLLLAALGSDPRAAGALVKVTSAVLLALGVAAAVAILLSQVRVLHAAGSTISLWLLLLVGTTAGAAGLVPPLRRGA